MVSESGSAEQDSCEDEGFLYGAEDKEKKYKVHHNQGQHQMK